MILGYVDRNENLRTTKWQLALIYRSWLKIRLLYQDYLLYQDLIYLCLKGYRKLRVQGMKPEWPKTENIQRRWSWLFRGKVSYESDFKYKNLYQVASIGQFRAVSSEHPSKQNQPEQEEVSLADDKRNPSFQKFPLCFLPPSPPKGNHFQIHRFGLSVLRLHINNYTLWIHNVLFLSDTKQTVSIRPIMRWISHSTIQNSQSFYGTGKTWLQLNFQPIAWLSGCHKDPKSILCWNQSVTLSAGDGPSWI